MEWCANRMHTRVHQRGQINLFEKACRHDIIRKTTEKLQYQLCGWRNCSISEMSLPLSVDDALVAVVVVVGGGVDAADTRGAPLAKTSVADFVAGVGGSTTGLGALSVICGDTAPFTAATTSE